MLMLFSMSVFYNPAFAKEKGGSKITTVKNSVKNSVSSLNVSTPIIPTVDVIAPIYGNTFAARPGEKGIDAYQFLLQANKLPVRVSSITLSAYYDHNGDGIYGTKYGQETVNGKTYYLKDVVKNIYIEDFQGRVINTGGPAYIDQYGKVKITTNTDLLRNEKSLFSVKLDVKEAGFVQERKKVAFDIVSTADVKAYYNKVQVKINDGDGNLFDQYQSPNKDKKVSLLIKDQAISIKNKISQQRAITAIPGQEKVPAAEFSFEALNETTGVNKLTLDLDIQKLYTGESGITTFPIKKVTIKYPVESEDQTPKYLEAYSYPTSDIVTFTDLQLVLIRSGQSNLEVFLDIAEEAADSKTYVTINSTLEDSFLAHGFATGDTYNEKDINSIIGNQKTVIFQSKPVFETVTDLSGCPSYKITIGSNAPIYCFSIENTGKNDIQINNLGLNIYTSGLKTGASTLNNSGNSGLRNIKIYNYFDQQNPVAENNFPNNYSSIEKFQFIDSDGWTQYLIPKNTKQYFIVKTTITEDNNPSTYTRIITYVAPDENDYTEGFNLGITGKFNNLAWSDLKYPDHGISTEDWYGGYALESLPTWPIELEKIEEPKEIKIQNKDFEASISTTLPGQTNLAQTFMFTSSKESIKVENLKLNLNIKNLSSGDSGLALYPIEKVIIKYPTNLETPEYLDGEAYYYPNSDLVEFTDLNFRIAKGMKAPLEVYFQMKNNAGNSTSKVNYFNNLIDSFKALGLETEKVYTWENINGVAGQRKTAVYQSKPVFKTVVDLEGCPSTEIIFGKDAPIYCFSIQNTGKNDIEIGQLSFHINAQGITTGSSGIAIYDYFDQSKAITTETPYTLNSIFKFDLYGSHYSEKTIKIPKNTIKYFIVKMTAYKKDPAIQSRITTNLVSDFYDNSAGSTVYYAASNNYQVWSDKRDSNHSYFSTDWYGGYGLESLPTTELKLAN